MIDVNPEWNLPLIATNAGATKFTYRGGQLYTDVDDTALQAAIDAYDHDAEMAKPNRRKGVLFEDTMCSATAEDQHGLSDLENYILAGNDVNFFFENGNTLVLTQTNWMSFRALWVPFRQSFFPLPK